MIKIIKEEKEMTENDSDDKSGPINIVYDIEVPVTISATEVNLQNIDIDSTKNRPAYMDLLKRYENRITNNIDLENSKYQILLDNDMEIIGDVIIQNSLLKIQMVSIPRQLVEDEIKSIITDYLTECYMDPYEDLIIRATPEEYNSLYAEEISNNEIKPLTKEYEKLLINMELELELDKIKINKC